MTYDLSEFRQKLPTQFRCVPLTLRPAPTSLHIARWPLSTFDSWLEFVQFRFHFSCVLQPFLSNPNRDELDKWFYPDKPEVEAVVSSLARKPLINQGMQAWMNQYYPDVSLDGFDLGRDGKLISWRSHNWPEVLGYDSKGYFCAFAADEIPFTPSE